MKMSRNVWIAVIPSLILAGCGEREFGDGQVHQIENQKVQLNGEQIGLTKGQVECGIQSELWTSEDLGEDQTIGRLTQSARDLGFGDDIQIAEPGLKYPHAQLRGKFLLSLIQVNSIKNDGPQNRIVDAKMGVRIDHSCFQSPFPILLGVKKGKFTDGVGSLLRFRLDDGWVYDEILH
jgi:hypothetical protein